MIGDQVELLARHVESRMVVNFHVPEDKEKQKAEKRKAEKKRFQGFTRFRFLAFRLPLFSLICCIMAFDSFGDFLDHLDAAGELRRIAEPLATELEITELADREMKKPDGGKALLFEKPTVNGQVSPFPLAINTLGSHRRMAMSMG